VAENLHHLAPQNGPGHFATPTYGQSRCQQCRSAYKHKDWLEGPAHHMYHEGVSQQILIIISVKNDGDQKGVPIVSTECEIHEYSGLVVSSSSETGLE